MTQNGIQVNVPPRPPSFRDRSQPHLIRSVESFYVRPRWLFVRVETETGVVGWGEGTLEGHTEAVEGGLRDIGRRLVGWDAMNISDIHSYLFRSRFYRAGSVLMSAMSGIDCALWDIKGKILGVPVWELLGGKVRERCEVYGSLGDGPPDERIRRAKERIEQGFKVVKMGGPEIAWMDSVDSLQDCVQVVKAVRELGLDIAVDFHGRAHRPMAKRMAALLEPYHPFFIEEPLLPGFVLEMKDVYESTKIPVALGERLYTMTDFLPYLEARCVDIVQPDLAHAGGITEVRKIAAMAEAHDMGFAPHCPLSALALAACLQVGFAVPNFLIQEIVWNRDKATGELEILAYTLNKEDFEIVDGAIPLLTKPGLGIEMDEGKIRAEAERNQQSPDGPWGNVALRNRDGSIREW